MSLALYNDTNESASLTNDATSLSPFTVTFDGRLGGAIDKLLYLRNDDSAKWYSGITIQAVDTSGVDIVDGSIEGFSWQLADKDIPLTVAEWQQILPANSLSMSDVGTSILGDTSTYFAFWVRVTIPRGQAISTIKDVILRISAMENAV